jgi:hypothetical protein
MSMDKIGSELAEELRDVGCAVDDSCISACKCGKLLDRAAGFVDGALKLAGCPRSGHAYIRVSCAHQLAFVEVTHLGPGTFDALTVDEVAAAALDALRTWTLGIGRSFAVERGPRDQLRISVVLEPDADGQEAPSFTRQTDATG